MSLKFRTFLSDYLPRGFRDFEVNDESHERPVAPLIGR